MLSTNLLKGNFEKSRFILWASLIFDSSHQQSKNFCFTWISVTPSKFVETVILLTFDLTWSFCGRVRTNRCSSPVTSSSVLIGLISSKGSSSSGLWAIVLHLLTSECALKILYMIFFYHRHNRRSEWKKLENKEIEGFS